MASYYRMPISYAFICLIAVVSGFMNISNIESRGGQKLLGNSCLQLSEITEGKDGKIHGKEGWTDKSCYAEVSKGIGIFVYEEPSQTTTSPATVINKLCGPITARATLQARNPDAIFNEVNSILEGPTTNISSLISAVQSNASVAAAESISQLSQSFQVSIEALQSSALSAIFQANVSAVSAISVASNQVQSAIAGASAAASKNASSGANTALEIAMNTASSASPRVTVADNRNQINTSQAQLQTIIKVAIATSVISAIVSSFISILCYYLISRYRNRKRRQQRQDDTTNYDHTHHQKRESYSSDNSHSERQILGQLVPQTSDTSRDEFSAAKRATSFNIFETKQPISVAREVNNDKEINVDNEKFSANTGELLSMEQVRKSMERNMREKSQEITVGLSILDPLFSFPVLSESSAPNTIDGVGRSMQQDSQASSLGNVWYPGKDTNIPSIPRVDNIPSKDDIGVAS